jgi:hypothetical protein
VDPARLSCIPNGVDVQRCHPRAAGQAGSDADDEAGLCRALALEEDAPLIGFVGRLSAEKGRPGDRHAGAAASARGLNGGPGRH